MFDAELRLPVSFQRVDADLSVVCDVGVEDLCEEEALGWFRREVLAQDEFHPEEAPGVGRPSWQHNNGQSLNIRNITIQYLRSSLKYEN